MTVGGAIFEFANSILTVSVEREFGMRYAPDMTSALSISHVR